MFAPKTKTNSISAFLIVLVCISFAGCRTKAQVAPQQATLTTTTEQTDSFDTAIEFLNNLDEYRPETVKVQILSNLGDWAREEKLSVDWTADPLLNDLPEELRPPAKSLEVTAFERDDVWALREAIWLRDITRMVAKQPVSDLRVQRWLDDAVAAGTLTADQVSDLSLTYRLFDWVVRNTQLDDANEAIDVDATSATGSALASRHRYYVWENLLYGHADYLERSRMLILLARQVQVECVMLVADRGADEPPQPWAIAAVVGDQFFLFDALLGLPLPGQGGAPLSTLAAYCENPALLDELVLGDKAYRIATSDLQNLVAGMDASRTAVSQRMRQLEVRLSGKYKMALTTTPSSLARRLRKSPFIRRVEIWPMAYRIDQFWANANLPAMPELFEQLKRESQPFEIRTPLMRGRLLHFRGDFRGVPNDPDQPGANKLYMNARLSNEELARFSTPLDVFRKAAPESPLILSLPEDPIAAMAEYQRRVEFALQNALWNKDNASIWLAMIAFDKSEYEVSKNHFVRLLQDDDTKWKQTARYNLGRSYEALALANADDGGLEKAIELYEADQESPQFAGNRLRAKMLRDAKE